MASIALALLFGALLNAGAFAATHYIEKATDKKDDNFDSETNRHNLATEKFDSDTEKYRENQYNIERWKDEQEKKEKDAEKMDQDINKSLKLYNSIKKEKEKEPNFNNYFQPSENQKNNELIFVVFGSLISVYVISKII